MFDKDGKLDARSQRILSEQTIPPRYGRSPAQDCQPAPVVLPANIYDLARAEGIDMRWYIRQESIPLIGND